MRPEEPLDIAVCIDRMHFIGVAPMIHSILANTERPSAVAFHIVVGAGESDELRALLGERFPDPSCRYEVREFRPTPFLDDYVHAGRDSTPAAYSSSVMNFSRFYLGEIYPGLGKYAYLDADVIVQGDVAGLFRAATLDRHDLAAVRIASFATWHGGFDLGSVHLRSIDPREPVFNAGVYVTELARWRRALPRLEHWMRIHRRSMKDFVFGTQSIMNLAFYRNVQILPPEWNVRPLGYDETLPPATLRSAKILHWAGRRKPWKPDGLYREYWEQYAPDLVATDPEAR